MRPGRRTPPVTVAVTFSGEMAADPVAAALRAQSRLRVLAREQAARAEAMLVVAHELDEETVKVMHDADRPPRGSGPQVVLVVTMPRDIAEAAKARSGPSGLSAYVAAAVARQIERDNLNDLITVAEAEHGPVTDEEIQALRDQLHQARDNQAASGANAA